MGPRCSSPPRPSPSAPSSWGARCGREPADPTAGMGPRVLHGSQVGMRRPRQREGEEVGSGDTWGTALHGPLQKNPAKPQKSVISSRPGRLSLWFAALLPTRWWMMSQRGWVTKETFSRSFTSGRGFPAAPSRPPASLPVAPEPSLLGPFLPPGPRRALRDSPVPSSGTRPCHPCPAAAVCGMPAAHESQRHRFVCASPRRASDMPKPLSVHASSAAPDSV